MFHNKYHCKAGSLQYVVVLGILLSSLCFSFLMLLEYKQLDRLQKWQTQKVKRKNKMEMEIALIQWESKNTEEINSNFFGLLELFSKSYTVRGKTYRQYAYVGRRDSTAMALYVANKSSFPIYLAGSSAIVGKVASAAAGFKVGSVDNKGFSGSIVITDHKISHSELPKLTRAFLNQLEQLSPFSPTTDKPFFSQENGNIVERSFSESTLILNISHISILEKTTVRGNIILLSEQPLFIARTAKLHDVVVVAPSIEIESNSRGNFQAIASKNISVGANSFFDYPSVFWVHRLANQKESRPTIEVKSGAQLHGILGLTSVVRDSIQMIPNLVIHPHSKIIGEVYSELPLALYGEILGSLYVENLIAEYHGKLFLNHLFNGKILGTHRPKEYAGLTLNDENPNTIMKWLY